MQRINPEELDPGIRNTVLWLRSLGYETTDSCDGVTKRAAGDTEALDYPHVFMVVYRIDDLVESADFLMRDLRARGVEVRPGTIQGIYDPTGKLNEPHVLALVGYDDAALGLA